MSIETVEIKNVAEVEKKIAVELFMAKQRQLDASMAIVNCLGAIKTSAERGLLHHEKGYAVSEGSYLQSCVRSLMEEVEKLEQAAKLEKQLRYLVRQS